MTTTNQASTSTADAAVEVTLSGERARIETVRTAVEVVTVARRIVTETVQVPVQLRREELVLTRRPVRAPDGTPAGPDAPVLGSLIPEPAGDLVIVLSREVPLVSVGVEAAERVTVAVTTVTDQRDVTTDLRREQAQLTTADNSPSPDNTRNPT